MNKTDDNLNKLKEYLRLINELPEDKYLAANFDLYLHKISMISRAFQIPLGLIGTSEQELQEKKNEIYLKQAKILISHYLIYKDIKNLERGHIRRAIRYLLFSGRNLAEIGASKDLLKIQDSEIEEWVNYYRTNLKRKIISQAEIDSTKSTIALFEKFQKDTA